MIIATKGSVMAEEKNTCYFYGKESEAFIAKLKEQEEG